MIPLYLPATSTGTWTQPLTSIEVDSDLITTANSPVQAVISWDNGAIGSIRITHAITLEIGNIVISSYDEAYQFATEKIKEARKEVEPALDRLKAYLEGPNA